MPFPHFSETAVPMRQPNKPVRDLRYWLDVWLGGITAALIVVGLGHFLDWLKDRRPSDGQLVLGCVIGYSLILLLYPRRLNVAIISLLALVAVGAVNALLMRSVTGLPLILSCALLAYLLLRWKGSQLK